MLAYDGDEVVGGAAVTPRADATFARTRKIPDTDSVLNGFPRVLMRLDLR